MQFEELEIKPQGSRMKRLVRNPQIRRTMIAIFLGAVIGFGLFYISEGRTMESIPANDIFKSLLIGGFFGFFITNSPCARGRC
jgi:L-asparagine transporter-like permease